MSLPLRRWLTPALAAASALTGGTLLTSPAAAGTQTIDAAIQYECGEFHDSPTFTERAIVTFKATVPATTSPGELVPLTDFSASLRLLAPGAPATTSLLGWFSGMGIAATGSDPWGVNPSGYSLYDAGNNRFPTTPNTDGGFGPVALPFLDFDPPPVRTTGADPVTLRAGYLRFDYRLDSVDGPYQPRSCRPLPDQPPLAVIPSLTTAPPPPLVTSISPTSGPVRGGNTVTLKGSGFSTPGTPIVTFSSNAFQGLDVKVIDDQTLTFKMPFSYGDGPVHIEVALANRTTARWPTPGVVYEFVGEFPDPTVTAISPSAGRPGDVLTLTGNDVDFITSIRFGDWQSTPVDTVIVSQSEIKVTVPAGPVGPATVRLLLDGVLAGGSFASGLGTFTYLAPLAPLPTITRVAPTSVRAGVPALGYIGGTRLSNVRTIQVGTKRVPPLLVASSSTVLFVAPALPAGTYPVRLVTKDGRLTPLDSMRTITYR